MEILIIDGKNIKKTNMKSKEEIEYLAANLANPNVCKTTNWIEGYTQCQEDNDWTKNCECESSIGQTWCCNQCGLPYDTRKSDKKYTEEDMYNCWQTAFTDAMNCSNKDYKPFWFKDYVNSLNKQD